MRTHRETKAKDSGNMQTVFCHWGVNLSAYIAATCPQLSKRARKLTWFSFDVRRDFCKLPTFAYPAEQGLHHQLSLLK